MTIDYLHSKSLKMVLDSLADGVYITDLKRKILYWNKAAEKITGWTAEDVHEAWMNIEEETLFRLIDENKKMIELGLERIP